MKGTQDGQLSLDLEAPEAPQPPCRMCHDRGWVPRSPLGWARCTWCEGGSMELEPEPEEPVEEWFVTEVRVYRVSACSEGAAVAAVGPDQEPVYHTTEAQPVEARRLASRPPALRVVG